MPDLHAARRVRLADLVAEAGADAAVITALVNVAYLSGLESSNAALLVFADRRAAVLSTDGRYAQQAAAAAGDLECVIDRATANVLVERAVTAGVRRLAFEAHDVTVERHAALAKAASPAEMAPLGPAVEVLRGVKDDTELALLREACAISERALGQLLDTRLAGRTEREVARDLEHRMLVEGADAPGFASIVASGPNSAVPHHRPTERLIAPGDLLKIDFGARYRGYHADLTRTAVIGRRGPGARSAAGWQADVHALVSAAAHAGRHALAPGVDVRDVDEAARSVIRSAGYDEFYPHGLGHGVGLEVHEAPLIGYSATGRLLDRTTVTVEPGVYLPGRGGVRIEDTLVVRDARHGGSDVLTTTTRDLLVLE